MKKDLRNLAASMGGRLMNRARRSANVEAAGMTTPPARAKLYHITHVDNLRDLVADGGLLSGAAMIVRGGPRQAIGMSGIKRWRVEDLDVDRHPGTKVGDYFNRYFYCDTPSCPFRRSRPASRRSRRRSSTCLAT